MCITHNSLFATDPSHILQLENSCSVAMIQSEIPSYAIVRAVGGAAALIVIYPVTHARALTENQKLAFAGPKCPLDRLVLAVHPLRCRYLYWLSTRAIRSFSRHFPRKGLPFGLGLLARVAPASKPSRQLSLLELC